MHISQIKWREKLINFNIKQYPSEKFPTSSTPPLHGVDATWGIKSDNVRDFSNFL